jgi:outer membrane protein TolC
MKTEVILAVVLIASTASAQPRHRRAQPEVAQKDDQSNKGDKEPGDGPEAQSALTVTIDSVIEVAVRLAPNLAKAKVDRIVALDDAAYSRRNQVWTVTSHAEYDRQSVADHVDVAPFQQVGTDKVSGGIGLTKNLPTGANLVLGVDLNHQTSEYNIPQPLYQSAMGSGVGSDSQGPYEYNTQSQTILKAQLTQPLGRGFGADVALSDEHKADLQATEATVKAQLAAEKMVHDIVQAYWDLAYQAYQVEILTKAVELAQQQEQTTHEQIRAGTVSVTQLDSVQYEIATNQEKLLKAQLELEQKSLELRQMSGLEMGRRDIVLRPGEPFVVGQDEFNVDEVLARARQVNRQLATNLLDKKIADVDMKLAQDQVKPKLDLSLMGSVTGQGEDIGTSVGGNDAFEVMIQLKMEFEVSGAARKKRDGAEAKKHSLDIDRADLERQIDVKVVTAVKQVTSDKTRVALEEKAIQNAEDNVRTARANFMIGKASNFEVMQAQERLIDARITQGDAIADYHKAVAELQYQSGIILDQYHVNVRAPRSE